MTRRDLTLLSISLTLLLLPMIAINLEGQENAPPPPHEPILIFGDAALNETHGVAGGSGSADDPYIISGLWFNCTNTTGITIENFTGHLLLENLYFIRGFEQGNPHVTVRNSTNISIRSCWSYLSFKGLEVVNSSDIAVDTAFFVGSQIGLEFTDCRNVLIKECYSSYAVQSGFHFVDTEGITMEACLSEHNNAVLGGSNGVFADRCRDVEIRDSEFSLCYGSGMMFLGDLQGPISSDISISGCYFDNNHNGIFGEAVDGIHIKDGYFSQNTYSIYISIGTDINVEASRFFKNDYGPYLIETDSSSIENSNFEGNDFGIILDGSSDVRITGNSFMNTSSVSVSIGTFGSVLISSGNSVHSNRFLSPSPLRGHALDNGRGNSWDSGGKGNLWLSFGYPDRDGNGIVDQPYHIGGNASTTDKYPISHGLLKPEEEPEPVRERIEANDVYWTVMASAGAAVMLLFALILLFTGRNRH
ncbi:MAG: NosD domain-containing protein [Thermoplasmatota archaeon]